MTKPLLTKKRHAWATQRKAIMKGGILHNNAALGDRYARSIKKLVKQMTDKTNREIEKLFKTDSANKHFGQDASIASGARILMNSLTDQFNQLFAMSAKPLAERMVNDANKSSQSMLYSSLKDLSGGLSIKTKVTTPEMREIMTASVAENVNLIKSIPQQYLQKVTGSIMRSITTGSGLMDLKTDITKYDGMTERRAENIALDQTRKAYNSINAKRAQKVGIEKFEWIHSGGGLHPREDHIALDGQIFSYDDLPIIDENTGETGLPGQAPNCKCTQRPIIDFGDDE
jgi:SPP1 gp7 family putative phage head morphogenesis protein